MLKTTAALSFVVALGCLAGCAGPDDSGAPEQGAQDLSAGAVTTIECTADQGAASTDDVAKFSFKVKGFKTPGAKFVESAWKVSDKDGHALQGDGEHSSVVAEGFDNGVDIHQCKKNAQGAVTCGSFVMSLDNSSSEMPVTITLTKKSNYRAGTLTIDNTINTGDNSGWIHAKVTCTGP